MFSYQLTIGIPIISVEGGGAMYPVTCRVYLINQYRHSSVVRILPTQVLSLARVDFTVDEKGCSVKGKKEAALLGLVLIEPTRHLPR